jgi:hypothetical protein
MRAYLIVMPLFGVLVFGNALMMLLSGHDQWQSLWLDFLRLAVLANAAGGALLVSGWVLHTKPAWHPTWMRGWIVVPVHDRDLAEEFVALNESGTVTLG